MGAAESEREHTGDPLTGIFTGEAAIDRHRVRLLLEALSAATAAEQPTQLLREVLDRVVEGTGAERGLLLLMVDRDRPVQIARGRGRVDLERLDDYSRSIPEEVFRTGRARRWVDDPTDSAVDQPESARQYRIQSVLCAPLSGEHGRPLGALYLDSFDESAAFREEDLDFVSALGHHLGPGLAQILRREAQARRDRLVRGELAAENRRLRRSAQAPLIAESAPMQDVVRLAGKVAPTDAPVLITGESGTGKERIAQLIHEQSGRAQAPLIVVNCATIPRELIESELFGHRKGAFTGATDDRPGKFALADGGTLFLDEIGELHLEVQAKLLRAIQQGEIEPIGGRGPQTVDVRILAATNRELEEMVSDGGFRQDLFFRLNVFPIPLPPLRERPEDLPALIDGCLAHLTARLGRERPALDEPARRALRAHSWPGNIRELENCIERALIIADDRIERAHLNLPGAAPDPAPAQGGELPDLKLENLERLAIARALARADGNKAQAARLLGIPRSSLYNKLREYALE